MRVRRLTVALVLVMLVAGCAMLQPQLPETPRDKADLFMSFYMAQLLDYNTRYVQASQSDVVAAMEIHILGAKYEFLQVAWEPIAMYDAYATSGQVPPATLEAEINRLINMLEGALEEGRE